MKKFFLKEGDVQQGPFDLDELKAKNITPETPVFVEGQTEAVPAGEINELKSLFTPVPLPLPTEEPLPTTEEAKPAEASAAAVSSATAGATATAVKAEKTKTAAAPGKKSTAWVSWVLTLLVLGGAGFFAYTNMNKGKTASASTVVPDSDTSSVVASNTSSTTNSADNPDTTSVSATTTDPATTATTTDPVTSATTSTTSTTTNNAKTEAQKVAAKKAEEDKKKKLEAQKKAEAEKKKQEAAQAALLAKELDMRNRWPSYIRFGNLNYSAKGEGIEAFDVPIYNGTDYMLDKVTVKIEYLKKKEKKIFKTENITLTNIPARTTINGRAPESKKGEKVNVIITSITSRKLHFCYPVNNGNSDDPYYCN